jgi:hypothetical protein
MGMEVTIPNLSLPWSSDVESWCTSGKRTPHYDVWTVIRMNGTVLGVPWRRITLRSSSGASLCPGSERWKLEDGPKSARPLSKRVLDDPIEGFTHNSLNKEFADTDRCNEEKGTELLAQRQDR